MAREFRIERIGINNLAGANVRSNSFINYLEEFQDNSVRRELRRMKEIRRNRCKEEKQVSRRAAK